MFGTQRGEYAILLFRPKSPEEIRLDEWREAFWPTTAVGRTAMGIETKRLKNQEDLEKTTRWRMKTWPKRIRRRMGRHIQHILAHHTFARKEVPKPYTPFWELRGRPEPWETRVPEAIQVLKEQAAKHKAEKKKVAKEKAQAKKARANKLMKSKSSGSNAAETALPDPAPEDAATGGGRELIAQQPLEQGVSEQNYSSPKPINKKSDI